MYEKTLWSWIRTILTPSTIPYNKDKSTRQRKTCIYIYSRNKQWEVDGYLQCFWSVCYSKRQTNTKLSTHYLTQTIQSMQLILCILRRLTNPLNTGENSKPLFFVNFSSLEQQRLRISVYSDNDGKKENPTSNHNRNKKK